MTEKGDAGTPAASGNASDVPLLAGPRPGDRDTAFFNDPMVDHLLRAIVTLAMEVSVSRERATTLEALLVKNGTLDPGAVDRHSPDEEDAAGRARQRSKLIEDILGPIVSRLSRED